MPSFQVVSVSLLHINFDENPDFEPDQEIGPFPFEVGGGHLFDEEDRTLYVNLGVRTPNDIDKTEVPFMFDVMYQGVFVFDPETDKNTIESCAEINCPAIIFPYIRECLGDVVRRGNFPPFILPTINFVKRAQKRKVTIKEIEETGGKKKTKSSKKGEAEKKAKKR
ncbi:protein translocase subunit [Desulfatibacillum aliphaticivorans]|uniref:Protein translocase subunit n=1 Tax=Desulfatibacillum aliphaticivorans TaxID=218208 RepID=B8FAK0_DESAL|nr:protein-export chaperone SecB [Desulfatibacillum aliphaticivorans]ACL03296.1 protein translocase subunit [Desulfatibacillum aliphaticivorans]